MAKIKTAVNITTTEETLNNLDVNLAINKSNVNIDNLIGQPFLSRSALCHAIFTKFNEDPKKTLEFLNLNK